MLSRLADSVLEGRAALPPDQQAMVRPKPPPPPPNPNGPANSSPNPKPPAGVVE
jgi:small subunit ribosomal protein S2